ncbi:TPA: hypothetical protein DCX16_05990 [bacterium]|nr:hypothetical protein [bacterium]
MSFLIPITLVVAVILYIAFVYEPKVDFPYQSEFLKEHQAQYLELEGYKIHYLKSGEGESVILVHGGGTWFYSFRNNIPFLSKHFSVYALDMPGHGYTEYSKEPRFDLDTFADVLNEFMNKLNISKATLVGNSWGGGWVLYFAMKYPDKVNRLVLIGSSGFNVPDTPLWELGKYPIIGEIISKFISLDLVRNSYKDVFYNHTKITDTIIYEVYKPLTFSRNRRATYLGMRNFDWKVTEKTCHG